MTIYLFWYKNLLLPQYQFFYTEKKHFFDMLPTVLLLLILPFSKEAIDICSTKQVLLKTLQNSQKNNCVGVSFLQVSRLEFCKILRLPTITHKIFETNSSFHVKQRTTGKVQFLFFKSFLLVLTKLSFSQGGWGLGYDSMKFIQFPDIS